MAVAAAGTNLDTDHAMAVVTHFVHMNSLDRFGETWPTAAAFELVGRRKQWLARDDIDIDSGFMIVEVFACAGPLGSALLSYAKLFGCQFGDSVVRFRVDFHGVPLSCMR